MCGIVGYVGPRDVIPVLTNGLEKLEYRGYDSAGVAYVQDGKMKVVKTKGRLQNLRDKLGDASQENTIGIGHPRWATHGEPSDINSHPHTNVSGSLAVVHNGIIENFLKLKEWLQEKGGHFVSETDTEVVAHLVNYYYEGDLKTAVMKAVKMLEGSYALGVVTVKEPDRIVAVRKDSPLIVGIGKGENLIASDVPAILEYTRDVYFLDDNEVAVIKKDEIQIYDAYGARTTKEAVTIDWDVTQAEKAGYEHFMIKEINEQPKALADTLFPRIHDGKIDLTDAGFSDDMIEGIRKIYIVACGTASYAAQVGKYVIERLARVLSLIHISGVLAMEPKILIMDEPIAGLDPLGRESLMDLVKNLNDCGMTILMISHNMDGLAEYASRILVMNQGELMMNGTPREVFREHEALRAAGLDLPEAGQLVEALRAKGIAISEENIRFDEVREELIRMLGGKAHD